MIYSGHDKSVSQKILCGAVMTALLVFSAWALAGAGFKYLDERFGWGFKPGDESRRYLLLTFLAVFYIRIIFNGVYLLKRKLSWEETATLPLGFAMYYVAFPLLGGGETRHLDFIDCFAGLLFLAGSFINTYSEILRAKWKKRPQNKSKLYTGGLFSLSRHINYFGDVVWVTGMALLTRNYWSGIIPVTLFCFFLFFNAPLLDKYLEKNTAKALNGTKTT